MVDYEMILRDNKYKSSYDPTRVDPAILLQYEPIFYEIVQNTLNTVSYLQDIIYLSHNDKFIQARFTCHSNRFEKLRGEISEKLNSVTKIFSEMNQELIDSVKKSTLEFGREFDLLMESEIQDLTEKHRNYTTRRIETAIFQTANRANITRLDLQTRHREPFIQKLYNNFKANYILGETSAVTADSNEKLLQSNAGDYQVPTERFTLEGCLEANLNRSGFVQVISSNPFEESPRDSLPTTRDQTERANNSIIEEQMIEDIVPEPKEIQTKLTPEELDKFVAEHKFKDVKDFGDDHDHGMYLSIY